MALRQSLLYLLCASIFSTNARAQAADPVAVAADPVSIATYEYTDNWNPVSFSTYPAQIITRLTTMRLFEKRCTGTSHLRGSIFYKLCQSNNPVAGDPDMELVLEKRCGISGGDVHYTVSQMNQVSHNDYFPYGLEVKLNEDDEYVLKIGSQRSPDLWLIQGAFTFPIVRDLAPTDIHSRVYSTGAENEYNHLTHGNCQVDEIGDNEVRLSSTGDKTKKLEMRYYDSFKELQQLLGQESRPDVVLAMPSKGISSDFYTHRKSPDLNNFVYMGFNFKSRDRRVRDLFGNRKFRESVAQTLWSADPIEKKMNVKSNNSGSSIGVFRGQSFSSFRPVNLISIEGLKTEVGRILRRKRTMPLNVLVSPFVRKLFSDTEFANITEHFKRIWSRDEQDRIEFVFVNPLGRREFLEFKDKGKFHLIFDAFFYGSNYLKYMAFLEPRNKFNFLGVNVFSRREIGSFMNKKEVGDAQFLDGVAKEFPVAVVGSLKLRDLFSTRRRFETEECPEEADTMPFTGLYDYMGVYRGLEKPNDRPF